MAVYFTEENLNKLEAEILEIFAAVGKDELLVSDIRSALMGNDMLGLYGKVKISRWSGLTAQHIEYLPAGKKYRSDLEPIGNFEDVLKRFGYKTRYERHGAGNKHFARI